MVRCGQQSCTIPVALTASEGAAVVRLGDADSPMATLAGVVHCQVAMQEAQLRSMHPDHQAPVEQLALHYGICSRCMRLSYATLCARPSSISFVSGISGASRIRPEFAPTRPETSYSSVNKRQIFMKNSVNT